MNSLPEKTRSETNERITEITPPSKKSHNPYFQSQTQFLLIEIEPKVLYSCNKSAEQAEEATNMQELTNREKELLDLVRAHPELLDRFIAELSTAQAAHPAPQD